MFLREVLFKIVDLFIAPSVAFPNLRILHLLTLLIITIAHRDRYYHLPHPAGEKIGTQRELV